MRIFMGICLFALAILGVRPALAVDATIDAAPSEVDDGHMVTVLWSPLYSAFSLHQFTVEARLGSKFGLAAIGGLGTVAYDGQQVSIKELGGRAQVYVVGDFDLGLQLGAQALYFDATATRVIDGGSVDASGTATAGGPFLGFKWASRYGPTLDAQAGGQYFVGSGEATAHSVLAARYGGPASVTRAQNTAMWLPILNVNVGWSF